MQARILEHDGYLVERISRSSTIKLLDHALFQAI